MDALNFGQPIDKEETPILEGMTIAESVQRSNRIRRKREIMKKNY